MISGTIRNAQTAWIKRVLGVVHGETASSGTFAPGLEQPKRLEAALAGWGKARDQVRADLGQLEAALRGIDDPRVDPAIILVKSIMAQISARPDNARGIAEVRRYLETDEVVDDAEVPNGFGITVRIREPLITALEALESAIRV